MIAFNHVKETFSKVAAQKYVKILQQHIYKKEFIVSFYLMYGFIFIC